MWHKCNELSGSKHSRRKMLSLYNSLKLTMTFFCLFWLALPSSCLSCTSLHSWLGDLIFLLPVKPPRKILQVKISHTHLFHDCCHFLTQNVLQVKAKMLHQHMSNCRPLQCYKPFNISRRFVLLHDLRSYKALARIMPPLASTTPSL